MKPIETTITATTVRMRYADKSDAAAAMEWVDIQVKISDLQRSSGTPMGDTERLPVAEVRRAALHRVRELLDAEIRRLSVPTSHTP